MLWVDYQLEFHQLQQIMGTATTVMTTIIGGIITGTISTTTGTIIGTTTGTITGTAGNQIPGNFNLF